MLTADMTREQLEEAVVAEPRALRGQLSAARKVVIDAHRENGDDFPREDLQDFLTRNGLPEFNPRGRGFKKVKRTGKGINLAHYTDEGLRAVYERRMAPLREQIDNLRADAIRIYGEDLLNLTQVEECLTALGVALPERVTRVNVDFIGSVEFIAREDVDTDAVREVFEDALRPAVERYDADMPEMYVSTEEALA